MTFLLVAIVLGQTTEWRGVGRIQASLLPTVVTELEVRKGFPGEGHGVKAVVSSKETTKYLLHCFLF